MYFQILLLIFYNLSVVKSRAMYLQSGLEGIHALVAYLQYGILSLLFCYSFGHGKYSGAD